MRKERAEKSIVGEKRNKEKDRWIARG